MKLSRFQFAFTALLAGFCLWLPAGTARADPVRTILAETALLQGPFGTIKAVNASPTSGASVVGSSVEITLTQAVNSVTVQVGGTWSATLVGQLSIDQGQTWTTLTGSPFTAVGGTGAWASGTNGLWTVANANASKFRITCTAYVSGTASISMWSSAAGFAGNTINTLPVQVHLTPSTAADTTTAQANATIVQNALNQASQASTDLVTPMIDNSATTTTTGASTVTITAYPVQGWNRALFVSISYAKASTPVSGVTDGGVSMTLLTSSPNTTAGLDVYYILNPSIGTASIPNIVVSNSDATKAEAITVCSVSGVASISAGVSNTGSGTSATNTLTSSEFGHVALDFVSTINGTVTSGSANISGPSPNATAPRYATQQQITQGTVQGSVETLVGATSVTLAWTVPSGNWTDIAVDLIGIAYQGSSANPGEVRILGAPGQNLTYYLALPAANNYAAIEAVNLNHVKLTIDPGVTVELANSANCYAIYAFGCRDFQIEGGIWNGNGTQQTVIPPSGGGLWNGYRGNNYVGNGLIIDNCQAPVLNNLKFTAWPRYTVALLFSSETVVHSIYAWQTSQILNVGCGNQGAHIYDLTGIDLTETLASIVVEDYPSYNFHFGGNSSGIVFDGIHNESKPDGTAQEPMRIAGGAGVYGIYGASISNVSGTLPTNVNGCTIIDDNTYTSTAGTIADDITFDNITITSQFSVNAAPVVLTGTHMKNVTIRRLRCRNFSTANNFIAAVILSGTIDSVRIEDSDMPTSVGFVGTFFRLAATATVNNDLTLRNCSFAPATSANGIMVNSIAGSNCTNLNLTNCTCINANRLVEFSGTVGLCSAVGCRTPSTQYDFNMNAASVIHAVGNDFSGTALNVLKNNTSSGTVVWRGSGNAFIPASNNNLTISASQSNASVNDSSFTLQGQWVTPQAGDCFTNINPAWWNGTGLYVMGNTGLVPQRVDRQAFYTQAAVGSAVTATASETQAAVANLPGALLGSGTTLRVKYFGIQTAVNGTDTMTVKVRFGANTLTGTVVVSGGAVTGASNNCFSGELLFTCRAASSASSAVVEFGDYYDPSLISTASPKRETMASTNFATNAALLVEVTIQFSSNNAGNSARVDQLVLQVL